MVVWVAGLYHITCWFHQDEHTQPPHQTLPQHCRTSHVPRHCDNQHTWCSSALLAEQSIRSLVDTEPCSWESATWTWQPIRHQYCLVSTNQRSVLFSVNQSGQINFESTNQKQVSPGAAVHLDQVVALRLLQGECEPIRTQQH